MTLFAFLSKNEFTTTVEYTVLEKEFLFSLQVNVV